MFDSKDVLYEDNHIIIVNKKSGDLVQTDPEGNSALEVEIKQWIKKRDNKPGDVFLGVVHRIDRPVSGAVLFAKTSKALVRLNEMIKRREIKKTYWAIVENMPDNTAATLKHYIKRDSKKNRSVAFDKPTGDAKEAVLDYKLLYSSTNYHLLEINLKTGRHHQIRAQLSGINSPIRGDLKYRASRSLPGGGICLHSRQLEFIHPVSKKEIQVTAPVPLKDNLWRFFEENHSNVE